MSADESCCIPSYNQSCCELGSVASTEEAVKKNYGKLWASQREGKSAKSKRLASMLSAHEALFKELKPQKGMSVLDIGSGNGETVLAIAEKVGPTGKAIGVDFSPEGIALAREKAEKRNLGEVAEFHLSNALELPLTNDYFDAVISECVVCLIKDKQKALNEKVRVLKPGGRVIMHDVITWARMPKAMRENQKLFCDCIGGAVSLDEYVEMMKKAGLTNIKTVDFTKGVNKKRMEASIVAKARKLKDKKAFHEIVDFARKGSIGYALLVGTKNRA